MADVSAGGARRADSLSTTPSPIVSPEWTVRGESVGAQPCGFFRKCDRSGTEVVSRAGSSLFHKCQDGTRHVTAIGKAAQDAEVQINRRRRDRGMLHPLVAL